MYSYTLFRIHMYNFIRVLFVNIIYTHWHGVVVDGDSYAVAGICSGVVASIVAVAAVVGDGGDE